MIQALEDRRLMAAQVILDEDLYRTLVIIDNGAGNDKVDVTSTQLDGIISTTVVVNNQVQVIDGYLDAVFIDLGAGNDRIDLALDGYSLLDTFVDVTLGSGNDKAKIFSDKEIGTIYGNSGNDKIVIERTPNPVGQRVFGGEGNDTIFGSMAADVLYGEIGNDLIVGYGGNDIIDPGQGKDLVYAGSGNDLIYYGDNDRLYGEGGDDLFHAVNPLKETSFNFRNRIDGGPGTDELDYYDFQDVSRNRLISIELTRRVEVIPEDPNELP
ncbi:MAG: hypothetical protein M3Q73_01205 [bacterium]|nr:hypothetical protein [bacterium]